MAADGYRYPGEPERAFAAAMSAPTARRRSCETYLVSGERCLLDHDHLGSHIYPEDLATDPLGALRDPNVADAVAIVRALAATDPTWLEDEAVEWRCTFCTAAPADRPADVAHLPTCPWRRARDWVAR